jgi:hypothetical protein
MSFREAIHRFCNKHLDLRSRIRNAFAAAQENNLLYVGVNLSIMRGEAAALQDVLNRGSQLCKMDAGYSAQELMKRLEATKDAIYYHPHLAPLIDSLNQMGNFNFLRRRNGLSRNLQSTRDMANDIKSTYTEYFCSVNDALARVGDALSRIEANFDTSSPSITQS